MKNLGNFELGDWLVIPDLGRITRGDQRVSLQPQVMDLLVYLANHYSEVVSTDELQGARKVLNAAALTYVAAFVTSLLTLLYWAYRLGLIGGGGRR